MYVDKSALSWVHLKVIVTFNLFCTYITICLD